MMCKGWVDETGWGEMKKDVADEEITKMVDSDRQRHEQ